jgi:large subunit ribosomal protein L9
MEVILREDYISLGYIGDTVRVSRGFARNFLIPRGFAVEASSQNERALKHKLGAIMAKRIKKKLEAESYAKVLEQVTVEFTLKMGAQGKSFGSVTTRDVEASLKTLGYNIDRRQIRLSETIKGPGLYKVEIKLHSEVAVFVQVRVIASQPPAGSVAAEKGKKKASRKKTAAGSEGESEEQTESTEVETSEDSEEEKSE